MLTKCVNCEFYVSANEKFCLNCGLSAPGVELHKNSEEFERNLTITMAFASAIVFSFIVLFLRSDGKFDNFSELPLILVGSLLFAFAFSIFISAAITKRLTKKEFDNRFAYLKVDKTLVGIEDTITMRNYELDKKYREIEKLLQRARQSNDEGAVAKLLTANELVLAQISRYELQNQKISLVRLQNSLRPILYNKDFSNEENKHFLENVYDAIAEIEDMRQSLTNDYAIEFPVAAQPEKHLFLAQLDETEAKCEKFRDALLNRQAARALRDVSPTQSVEAFQDEQEIFHAVETFNIQATLTDFSESFDKLEFEYECLKAEETLSKSLKS